MLVFLFPFGYEAVRLLDDPVALKASLETLLNNVVMMLARLATISSGPEILSLDL